MERSRPQAWSFGRLSRSLASVLLLLTFASEARSQGRERDTDLFDLFGEYGGQLRSFSQDSPLLFGCVCLVLCVAICWKLGGLFKSLLASMSRSDSSFGLFVARCRLPMLLRDGKQIEAAEILLRLGETKAAADAYFKGELWAEAAELYYNLGVRLKAARAYESDGNYATAATTYEALEDYESAERCYRMRRDLRSIAAMWGAAGQHRRAATMFRELGLVRDEAEALESAGMHEASLALWQSLFRNYSMNPATLSPLSLRERNSIAAHVFVNLDMISTKQAEDFLRSIPDVEGVVEVLKKRGEFERAARADQIGASPREPRAEPPAPTQAAPAPRVTPRRGSSSRRMALPEPGPTGAQVAARDTPSSRMLRSPDRRPEASPARPSAPSGRGPAQSSPAAGRPPAANPSGPPRQHDRPGNSPDQRAQALLQSGDYMSAGELFEEISQLNRAIEAYELALEAPPNGFREHPPAAWQRELVNRIQWLYERSGNPKLASDFLTNIGLEREAAQLLLKLGDQLGAAHLLAESGAYTAASEHYSEAGDQRNAHIALARAREQEGRPDAAGELYLESGLLSTAAEAFNQARATGHITERQWRSRMARLDRAARARGEAPATSALAASPQERAPSGGYRRPEGLPDRSSRMVARPGAAATDNRAALRRLPGMVPQSPPRARPSEPANRPGRRHGTRTMMPRVGGGGRPSASGDRPRSQQDAMFAQAQTLESQGHFIEAGNLFNQLALGERARDCFKEAGDWRSVAESWRGEEKHYPAGILFFALGDVDDALRELIRVPDDDLDCLPARRVVAILYGLIEQYGDSRTYFDASFSDTVGAPDVEALYYYGQVLEAESHTWPDALSIYETVLELSPGYRDTVQRFEALERGQPRRPTSIYDDAQNDSNSLFYALQEDVMSR